MVDRVKEKDRKGWKERGINYQSSKGRRDSAITPYLCGIYNYIMMHPLSHQVNRQSLFLALAVTPSSLFLPAVLALPFFLYPVFSQSPPLSKYVSCFQREKWGGWFMIGRSPARIHRSDYKFLVRKMKMGFSCSTTAINPPLSKAMNSQVLQ